MKAVWRPSSKQTLQKGVKHLFNDLKMLLATTRRQTVLTLV